MLRKNTLFSISLYIFRSKFYNKVKRCKIIKHFLLDLTIKKLRLKQENQDTSQQSTTLLFISSGEKINDEMLSSTLNTLTTGLQNAVEVKKAL